MATQGSAHFGNADRRPLHTKRILGYSAFVATLLAGCLFGYSQLSRSPEYRIQDFSRAVSRGDGDAILSMASADEVRHLGITPANLQAFLSEIAVSPSGVKLVQLSDEHMNANQSRYNRAIRFRLTSPLGVPLLDAKNIPVTVVAIAYNTPEGWRIALTKFLSNISSARGVGRYSAICRKYGVSADVFEPSTGSWRMSNR